MSDGGQWLVNGKNYRPINPNGSGGRSNGGEDGSAMGVDPMQWWRLLNGKPWPGHRRESDRAPLPLLLVKWGPKNPLFFVKMGPFGINLLPLHN